MCQMPCPIGLFVLSGVSSSLEYPLEAVEICFQLVEKRRKSLHSVSTPDKILIASSVEVQGKVHTQHRVSAGFKSSSRFK
jgi:hypothetical protein